MPNQRKEERRRPTDEELSALTSPDVLATAADEASQWWDKNAPREAKGLLETEPEPDA